MPNKLRPCRPKRRWQMLATQPTYRRLEHTVVVLLAMLTPWVVVCPLFAQTTVGTAASWEM